MKEEQKQKQSAVEVIRAHFTAPRMAYMAIFTALAFVVTFLEFPIFPAAPFLKFDFANVFFMIEGFIFGPIEAVFSIIVKELLCLTKSSTAGVGEVANFLMSTSYVIIPSVGYRYLKGRKWVCVFIGCACIMQIGVSLLVNRFINFPLYGELMGFDPVAFFADLWHFVLLFNLIKSVGISIVVFLLYKPLSRFIKMTSNKFDLKMKSRKRRAVEQEKSVPFPQTGAEEEALTEAEKTE